MNIAVIGTGYVGLVGGTCLAEAGNNVVCVDIDEAKVAKMKNGIVPIYEPGLEELFKKNTEAGRLSFTTNLAEGIKDAKIIFLALPTPPGADGAADLSFVLKVADDLSQIITDYKVIVDKSTVPVGTAEKVHNVLASRLDESLFDVVSNPEFLREGVAVPDFMEPDRIVVGTSSDKAKQLMLDLYDPYIKQGSPVIIMDERSAEMTKYAANSYLATRISFMNEIANLCEKVGANVDMVRQGMGSDGRIGNRFLYAGVGYGGSCFPKDVKALAKAAGDNEYEFKILNAVMTVNALQKKILADRVIEKFGGDLSGHKIAIWGLAFKPNTDDIREAPALEIIDKLLAKGAEIVSYDPEAMDNVKAIYGDKIGFANSPYDTLDDASALVIVTEWDNFRTADHNEIKRRLKNPIIYDGRNIYETTKMDDLGFEYSSIGRPS